MRDICLFLISTAVCLWFPLVSFAQSGEKKEPPRPPAPKEFAYVLSNGYGEGDRFSNDPKIFENLLINMRKSGFNTIHCVYRDWRVELCRKHKVKMMIDVLAWKEGGGTDIRKPDQRAVVKKICEKARGDDAVWGYNLWNETLSFFGNPDGKNVDAYIAMLKEWDPTHPVWLGTRTVSYANAPKQKPGVHGYYDYPWHRGFLYHFADLMWYYKYVPSQDGYIGRWEQGSNFNWNSYSLNTSIVFGTKVTIWFIGGPFDKEGHVDPRHRFHHLVKLGQEMQLLYPELGKIGRPTDVFSTPTAKTHDNKPRDRKKDKGDTPWRLPAFPRDFWFQVHAGEVLAGFFRYPSGEDAVFVANHNAFLKQPVVFTIGTKVRDNQAGVEIFDRATGQWRLLKPTNNRYAFDLRPGGGELLRIRGRRERAPPGQGGR
ncbi:MAG: hypothetical protein HYX68_00250 [Planctomycetes bacterium]|jgi:hypothetical protein|nr:hypothetical protein [Planctomycetota bacterium]